MHKNEWLALGELAASGVTGSLLTWFEVYLPGGFNVWSWMLTPQLLSQSHEESLRVNKNK